MQVWGGGGQALAINPLAIDEKVIAIKTIAHALSNQCRFAGHTETFFSVAQHCLNVVDILESESESTSIVLTGLLHDASEAYCVDIPNPLKMSALMEGYRVIEDEVQRAVARRFYLPFPFPKAVSRADLLALAWERRDILQPHIEAIWAPLPEVPDFLPVIEPMPPHKAELAFLKAYQRLENDLERQAFP